MHEPTMEDVERQIAGKVLFLIGLFILFAAGAFLMTFSDQFNTTIAIGLFFVILPVVLTWGGLIVRAIMLGLAVVAFLIGLLVGYCETAGDYDLALEWMQDGKYEDARNLFDNLIGFRDCEEKVVECDQYIEFESIMEQMDTSSPEYIYRRLHSLKGFAPADEVLATPAMQEARESALTVGNDVSFGRYHRNSSISKDPVTWTIIARDGNRALLFSSYTLGVQPFHDTEQPITWADCSLRRWLNGALFQALFTPEEQELIALTEVSIGDNHTEDYLFLLSVAEVHQYLPDASDRKLRISRYFETRYDKSSYSNWLLRPVGETNTTVPCINYQGAPWQGVTVSMPSSIRPALWVTLDPNFF